MIVSVVLIGIVFTALVVLITSNHQHMNAMRVFNMAGTTVAVVAIAAILSYLVGYESGQIDQASGVATVTLTTQPNGESRWEPTTKASK